MTILSVCAVRWWIYCSTTCNRVYFVLFINLSKSYLSIMIQAHAAFQYFLGMVVVMVAPKMFSTGSYI